MSVIESRLSRAVEEAQGIEAYDYLVVNDDLDECVEEVHSNYPQRALPCDTESVRNL